VGDASAYFRRLFEHEQVAHGLLLASLEAVPTACRAAAPFQQAVDLLAHLAAARRMWLARLGFAPAPAGGFDPKGTELGALPGLLSETHALWSRYLAGLTDADIARPFEYQSTDAGCFRNTLGEVLTQLHGHSCHHRGQIALHLRALGQTPPITDFIFWARQPVK
jgi:uncharacterized damage-inducible protein DinB